MNDQFFPRMMPILETLRLIVRPLAGRHLLACHRLFVDIGWVGPGSSDAERLEERRRWSDCTIRNYIELGQWLQPPYGGRAIVLKDGDACTGLVELLRLLAPFCTSASFPSSSQ